MDSAIHLLLNKRGQCGKRQGRAKFLVEGDNVGARLEPRSSDLNLKVLNPQPPRLFVMEMEHLLKGKGERSKRTRQEKNKCNLSVGHPSIPPILLQVTSAMRDIINQTFPAESFKNSNILPLVIYQGLFQGIISFNNKEINVGQRLNISNLLIFLYK